MDAAGVGVKKPNGHRNADSRLRSHRRSVLGSSGVRRIAPSDPVDRFAAPIARRLPDRASDSPVFMPVLGCPSATLLSPTTNRHQLRRCHRNKRCCHRDGIGPGSRRSTVSSRPISALPPDFSGCSSAFAGPGASVRTLYTVVTKCQYFSRRVLENYERGGRVTGNG